jgi:hypothetical protein
MRTQGTSDSSSRWSRPLRLDTGPWIRARAGRPLFSLYLSLTTLAPGRALAVDLASVQSAEARLEQGSSITLSCITQKLGPYSPRGQPFNLNDTCDLHVSWKPVTVIQDVTYTAESVVIRAPGSADAAFSHTLPLAAPEQTLLQTIYAGEWYTTDRFKTGTVYNVYIQYKASAAPPPAGPGGPPPAQPAPPVTWEEPIQVYAFRPVKSRWAGQFTGKVFTAWQLSSNGDQSYIVPGLAAGLAFRFANDYNDQDVIALRAVAAAGPNLISKSTVNTDSMGKVTGIQNTQQFQVLLGVEVVLARYISAGVAFPVLGGAPSTGPLLLLTYGELYPAASTK